MEAGQNTQQKLEQVRGNIERWRQTREKLGAMPAPLWEEAAADAREAGTHRVARALGLNYVALKQRAFPSARAEAKHPLAQRKRRTRAQRTTFVEMKPRSATMVHAAASELVIVDVIATSGARLTLRLNGGAVSPDLATLIASFR